VLRSCDLQHARQYKNLSFGEGVKTHYQLEIV
jgi:hypothetical protein